MTVTDAAESKKHLIAGTFSRAARGYQGITHFPPLGRRLVELAQIPGGATALDVATGRGAILFPLAQTIGAQGKVIGVDISPGMVEETAAEVVRRGLTNVEVQRMDAEELAFPDATFDSVLCGFALQFLPHLERGLAEFRRVLRPQGRLALSTWGADDERWAWYQDLRRAYGATIKLQSHSFEEPAWLEDIVRAAGFEGVWGATEPFDWVCVQPEDWWEAQWSMSSRAGLEQLEPQALQRFKAEVFHAMQAMEQPDGFHELLRARFTLARKA
jgi:ubiquinone/menaquinone biosynthesis C-methylase UbiE